MATIEIFKVTSDKKVIKYILSDVYEIERKVKRNGGYRYVTTFDYYVYNDDVMRTLEIVDFFEYYMGAVK